MAKQQLKIMSWNIETLRDTNGFLDFKSLVSKIRYITEVIRSQKPDIVCIIELDVRNATLVTNKLTQYLGTDYRILGSAGVYGGMPGIGGTTGNNEMYLVIYKTDTILVRMTGDNTPRLIQSPFAFGKPFQRTFEIFKRAPFGLIFNARISNLDCILVVVHLELSDRNKTNKIEDLINVGIKTKKPVFCVGDFNFYLQQMLDTVLKKTTPQSQDIVNVKNRQPDDKRPLASVLRDLNSKDSQPVLPSKSSLDYRINNTSVDNIVNSSNSNTPQYPSNPPSSNPSTGIVDLINNYLGESSVPAGNQYTTLNSIPIQCLNGYQYQLTTYEATADMLWNGWCRYRGGISDHLPVVMTIEVG